MGMLIDGVWSTDDQISAESDGQFKRAVSGFRNWITPDGNAGPTGVSGYAAESGRYHLYVSHACPWAHRTMIFRNLKSLALHISVDVVHPDMFEHGWQFTDGYTDSLNNHSHLHQIYAAAAPDMTGRVSVPVLWDKATNSIVSNESAEIIRMFNSAFNGLTGNDADYYPTSLRAEIDPVNERIYQTLNNGVYRSGFARSQAAYDEAVGELFETLDWVDDRLEHNRYIAGDVITEADWRLFTTLLRFDAVYVTHFKCDKRRIVDYPNTWAYARELFQHPGVAETVHMDHIRRHYFFSHESVNPTRIISIGADADWSEPHGRG
ncbi:MAG: glutathione S-transferase family protein [Pikeienuella sp.]